MIVRVWYCERGCMRSADFAFFSSVWYFFELSVWSIVIDCLNYCKFFDLVTLARAFSLFIDLAGFCLFAKFAINWFNGFVIPAILCCSPINILCLNNSCTILLVHIWMTNCVLRFPVAAVSQRWWWCPGWWFSLRVLWPWIWFSLHSPFAVCHVWVGCSTLAWTPLPCGAPHCW